MGKHRTMCELGKKLSEGGRKELTHFSALVSEPRFVCLKCGRVAGDDELLCKPARLKDKKKAKRRR